MLIDGFFLAHIFKGEEVTITLWTFVCHLLCS
jgi:hypothetical protein